MRGLLAAAAILLLAIALSGCFGDGCQRFVTPAYADLRISPMPGRDAVDAALTAEGWTLLPGENGSAIGTKPLPDGGTAQVHLGIPDERGRGTTGLFFAVAERTVTTDEASREVLAGVVEPLGSRLQAGPAVYSGGVEHCGAV